MMVSSRAALLAVAFIIVAQCDNFLQRRLSKDVVDSRDVDELRRDIRKWAGENRFTNCSRNTFIADWGSTGARIYLAHWGRPKPNETKFNSSEKIKISKWLDFGTDKSRVEELLKTLKDELSNTSDALMAAMATAGNRLVRNKSKAVWEIVRETPNSLFQQCNRDTDAGCRTLNGSVEALCEFYSAYPTSQEDSVEGKLVGMISAGGASIQMAFNVSKGDEQLATDCASELGEVIRDTEYIVEGVNFDKDKSLLHMSFLSVRKESAPSKFAVGGMNEMRAAFDRYLILKQFDVTEDFDQKWFELVGNVSKREEFRKHPCLNGAPVLNTSFRFEKIFMKDDNDTLAGTPIKYISNGRNDYITMLQGKENPTTKECGDELQAFVAQDAMVKVFARGHCKRLASKVEQWKLISSFFFAFDDVDGTPDDRTRDGQSLLDNWRYLSGSDFNADTYPSSKVVPRQTNKVEADPCIVEPNRRRGGKPARTAWKALSPLEKTCNTKGYAYEPRVKKGKVASPAACQEICARDTKCSYFSFWARNQDCFFSAAGAKMRRAKNSIAGPVLCSENGYGYATHFDRAILMEVLKQLGVVENTDKVSTEKVEWLEEAGQRLAKPLAPGWLADNECDSQEVAVTSDVECPSGTQITTSSECEAAAVSLGITWNNCCQDIDNERYGCTFRIPDNDIIFNGRTTAKANLLSTTRNAVCTQA